MSDHVFNVTDIRYEGDGEHTYTGEVVRKETIRVSKEQVRAWRDNPPGKAARQLGDSAGRLAGEVKGSSVRASATQEG